MDLKQISILISGLVLFLYAMELISTGMREAAGRRLRTALAYVGRSRLRAVPAGAGLALALNSSSAASAMMVALSGAGLVGVTETFGVLLGTGLGTSLTVQILTFNISQWAFVLMGVGLVGRLASRREQTRYVWLAVLGVGMVFFGLSLMKMAMSSFRTSETAEAFLGVPALALVGATVLTGIIQSSAATIILIQGLAESDAIGLTCAVMGVIGANIGTCATALIGSLNAGRRGRQVALFNIILRIATALVVLPFVPWLVEASEWTAGFVFGDASSDRTIAMSHTLFNLCTIVLFGPFLGAISRLFMAATDAPARRTPAELPESKQIEADPEAGLAEVLNAVVRMSVRTSFLFKKMIRAFDTDSPGPVQELRSEGEAIATLDEVLTALLDDVDSKKLDDNARHVRYALLGAVAELGRIASLVSKTGMDLARDKIRQGVDFSMESAGWLRQFHRVVAQDLAAVPAILLGQGTDVGARIIVTDRDVDEEYRRLLHSHRKRRRSGVPADEHSGLLYRDMLTVIREIHARVVHLIDKLQAPLGPTR